MGFTAAQIAVWFIRREKDGVTTRQLDDVEEEDAETADVSRVEFIQQTHQALFTMSCCSMICIYIVNMYIHAYIYNMDCNNIYVTHIHV